MISSRYQVRISAGTLIILTKGFRGVCRYLQDNDRVSTGNKLQPLPFTSFPIRYLLIAQTLNPQQPQVLIASVRKT
jgi:hypothetical protein